MSELDVRLSEGREAVATMDPPEDLWARVVERASNGDAYMRDLTSARHRWRPSPWLAVAAVAAAVVLVVALVSFEDRQKVDTAPPANEVPEVTSMPLVPAPETIVSGVGCPFGIAGDPIVMQPGPVDPLGPRFDAEAGQGIGHAVLGSQVAEVRVPGFDLTTDGWRMEDIELERGAAKLWLDGPPSGDQNKPFVQVRFFPGTQEPCSSFTVTVDGGSEDANRQTAIDLAERIVLPSELEGLDLPGAEGGPVAGLELAGTEWEVNSTSSGSPSGVGMSFSETTVTWDNGCATVSANYELDRNDGFLTLTNSISSDPGCTPPTSTEFAPPWPAIDSVMGSERIPVSFVLDRPAGAALTVTGLLRLGDYPGGSYMILAPA